MSMKNYWKLNITDDATLLEEIKTTNRVVQFSFESSNSWVIEHNYNTSDILVQCFDSTGVLIYYNSLEITNNTITINFTDDISGYCNILFNNADITTL